MTETNAYTQSPWSLKDLFNGFDDANIDATYQQMEALITNFEAYRAELQRLRGGGLLRKKLGRQPCCKELRQRREP